jgi:acetyl esterase/lipase
MPAHGRNITARIHLLLAPLFLLASAAVAMPVSQIAIGAQPVRSDVFPHTSVSFPEGVTAWPDVEYSYLPGYRPLLLDLYLPKTAGQRPLVIWIHGGATFGDSRVSGAIADFPATLAALAAHGYAVASINNRLRGEAKFPAQIQDVKAAIIYLRAHAAPYGIDPSRVVLWGGSAGGYLAALAATSSGVAEYAPLPSTGRLAQRDAKNAKLPEVSDGVQGAVIWYGIFDLEHHLSESDARLMMGCDCKEKFGAASPINRVTAATPPMLLIHGTADAGTPVQQSQAMEDRLKAAGVPVQSLYLPDVEHFFIGRTPEATRDANHKALQATFDYIDATFKK